MKKKLYKVSIFTIVIIDIFCIGVGLVIFALFHHVIPKNLDGDIRIVNNTVYAEETQGIEDIQNSEKEVIDFADKFNFGEIIQTENSYISDDMSIVVEKVEDSGVTYYVADIYLNDSNDLMTAFAQDTYGKAFVDSTLNMANNNDAIIAISGDYYGNGEDGLVIRNGVLYRDDVTCDVLVMNADGSMETYSQEEFNIETVMAEGAYQGWSFGPTLLEEGQAIEEFDASRHLLKDNPRCGIGYYEQGHYCFVVADGRQEGYSEGMTLEEFSKLFYDLGCSEAYNMDGGKSAVMVFMGEVVNQPASGGREISDIVYIAE